MPWRSWLAQASPYWYERMIRSDGRPIVSRRRAQIPVQLQAEGGPVQSVSMDILMGETLVESEPLPTL